MLYYLKGEIVSVKGNSVIIDVKDFAYQVFVAHTEEYNVGDKTIIYIHNVIREDGQFMVGFKSIDEKSIFETLIKVKGLGPKTVINALSKTNPQTIVNAIASNNVAYLKKLPSIGSKAAAQIILDLKGKLTGTKGNPKLYDEVFQALKELGFKGTQIDRVLATINEPNATAEDILRLALNKLRN